MLYVWVILLVATVVLELSTAQMVSIWFSAGALASLIATFLGAELWLQILLFVVVSAAALLATRPFVKKLTRGKKIPTNADRFVGGVGVVLQEIDNQQGVGQVKVEGAVWSARSETGEKLPAGEQVRVCRIEGVKLIVGKVDSVAAEEEASETACGV
jgi:membrane protein implicated in regulation of membrane protease activity